MFLVRAIKTCVVLLLILFAPLVFADKSATWQKIDVPLTTFETTDGNGVERLIAPSCSAGPVCAPDPATGKPVCRLGEKQFSFYFKPGKSKKLLVYFDGGGACWDSNTCITGALTPLPAYVPELRPNNNPATMGGLFDLVNPDNPYRDWSMAVIPYCTGDVHWGSKDTAYTDYTGAVTGTPGGQVTIHHRGFDNFLYVRSWLQKRYGKNARHEGNEEGLKKLLVTGSSAGAYGAVLDFPHLRLAFPEAKAYVLADGGAGVVTDGFLQQAVQDLNRWGAQQNIAHWIPGMDALPSTPADRFFPLYYAALAGYYPQDRFSEYNTHWDIVQTLVLNIMLNQNDIPSWSHITPGVYGGWVQGMQNNIFLNAVHSNFRYYVAPGCNHTVLRFSDDFYKPGSASFLSWFKALTKDPADEDDDTRVAQTAWKNIFCENCSLPPQPPEISACLARSFSR